MLDAAITSRFASADYTAPDNTNIGNIKSTVDSATYGLAALKVLIDNIDDYVDEEVASIKGVTDKLDTAMVVDGDVYKFTANALEEVAVDISGLSTFDPDTDTVDIGKVNGVAVTNIDDFKAETPTVGEIADEVRAELATELARIDENISAPKALADGELDGISTLIELQVTAAINSAVPTALDAYDIATLTDIQGTLRGSGASEGTVLITDTDDDPIADTDVWVTTDEAGENVVAGTLQTNSNGLVTFWLDAGVTYYVWCQKDGKNFSNPTEFEWL